MDSSGIMFAKRNRSEAHVVHVLDININSVTDGTVAPMHYAHRYSLYLFLVSTSQMQVLDAALQRERERE